MLPGGAQGGGGAAFDRTQGGVGVGGDLTLREPPEVGEHEHLTMCRRERRKYTHHLEAAQYLLGDVALPGLGERAGGRHGSHPRAPTAGEVRRPVARYAVHPGRERGPRRVEAGGASPHGEEDVLHQVLGEAAVSEVPHPGAVDQPAVAVVELRHGPPVTRLGDPPDQNLVASPRQPEPSRFTTPTARPPVKDTPSPASSPSASTNVRRVSRPHAP